MMISGIVRTKVLNGICPHDNNTLLSDSGNDVGLVPFTPIIGKSVILTCLKCSTSYKIVKILFCDIDIYEMPQKALVKGGDA